MKSKHILILFISLCITSLSADLFANSFADTFGFSAEGIARGNAMAAVVDDWSSLWYNVAGLGKTQGITKKEEGDDKTRKEVYANQLAIGYLLTVPKLSLKIPQRFYGKYPDYYPVSTKKVADKKPYGYITFGGALDLLNLFPLPDFISSARLGFSMSVNQNFSMANISNLSPFDHNFIRYGKCIQNALIMSGLGFGFLDDAFGGGVGINMNFHGKIRSFLDTSLSPGLSPAQFPVASNSFDLNIVPGAIAGVYLSPGKFTKALEGLEFGASYREETKLRIFPFSTHVLIIGFISYSLPLIMDIQDYYSPHTVNGSIAYTRWGVTLSAEVGWEMWSMAYPTKNVRASYLCVPRYHDIIVYKAGIKYDTPLNWLTVMFGYSFVPSILPKNVNNKVGVQIQGLLSNWNADPYVIGGMFNYLDNDKHLASLGLKFTIPKPGKLPGQIYLTLAYQFQYLVPRSATKLGDLQTIGTNAWFDSYLYNPSYRYGGMNHSIGVEVGVKI